MNFKSQESAQKLRGGYYTPPRIADFLSRWVLANQPQQILEPSCGDGAFLQALYRQIVTGEHLAPAFIEAVELIPQEAEIAAQKVESLRRFGTEIRIINDDFFNWLETVNDKQWDAIIGNPPYIRYQYFEANQRERAQAIFKQAKAPFSKRTNAWVPFVMASVMHLAPQGRLAMVIPAEIMHVHHAKGLRLFLEQEMALITLIHFREIVFSGTLQGVVLLLGIKQDRKTFMPLLNLGQRNQRTLFDFFPHQQADLNIIDLNDIPDLQKQEAPLDVPHQHPPVWNGNWMSALLNDEALTVLEALQTNPHVHAFEEIAAVDIGIVTGANKFFVVNDETCQQYKLEAISAPMLAKSELIKGISYTEADHLQNRIAGKDVHFLSFPDKPLIDLPPSLVDYLRLGEAQNLPKRYKCRIREPWYVVPYVWVSEISLLKRCHHFPRLVLNELGAYATDTAYRIKVKPAYTDQAKNLVFSFLNSLTFLYAELLGRHYGGGVLELVPSEVEQLQIPLISVTDDQFAKVDEMIRHGVSLDDLVTYTDSIILAAGLRLSEAQIDIIRAAHRKLRRRRLRVGE